MAAWLQDILEESPLKAAGFIVTIYGDVVEPRREFIQTNALNATVDI